MQIYYSFIIPVFNRPQEVRELLESFINLDFGNEFEIVLVEDGSTETSESVVAEFSNKLSISYYYKNNSGPGDSRNYGMKRAKGNYFIILDSDCLLPPHYLTVVNTFLNQSYYHCFGGWTTCLHCYLHSRRRLKFLQILYCERGKFRKNTRQSKGRA